MAVALVVGGCVSLRDDGHGQDPLGDLLDTARIIIIILHTYRHRQRVRTSFKLTWLLHVVRLPLTVAQSLSALAAGSSSADNPGGDGNPGDNSGGNPGGDELGGVLAAASGRRRSPAKRRGREGKREKMFL